MPDCLPVSLCEDTTPYAKNQHNKLFFCSISKKRETSLVFRCKSITFGNPDELKTQM
jgi:hypothetical protein